MSETAAAAARDELRNTSAAGAGVVDSAQTHRQRKACLPSSVTVRRPGRPRRSFDVLLVDKGYKQRGLLRPYFKNENV
jgi:hypothetical protein